MRLPHVNSSILAAVFLSILIAVAKPQAAEVAPAPPEMKHALRYKFSKGEAVRTKVLHLVSLNTTISGSTQTAETTSGSVKLWRILDVDPAGLITLEHAVESVDMRQKMTGRQEVTYNSKTDKQAPPGYETVAKAVGIPLTVVTVDGTGKMLRRVEKRDVPPADAANNQMLVPLPAEPIAVGESWNVPVDVNIALEDGVARVIKTRQHYTLEKVAGGVATIAVVTQVLTPVNNPKIQSQLIQRLTKGTIRFDIDAGRVLSQQLDLDERVLGFNGGDSSLHYLGRFTEEYLPPAKTAAVAKPQAATK